MSLALAEKIPAVLRGRFGLSLFVVISISATVGAAFAFRKADEISIAQEFERRQNLRHAFLQQSLSGYESSLFALRLVAENNVQFEPGEFERAARDIHARSPGIQSIQWVPIVTGAQLDAFRTRVRDLIDPGFTVRQRTADGTVKPIPETFARDETQHAIITYLYPSAGNESAAGYDIFTAATAPELQSARRTLDLTLTRPLLLVQGFDGIIFTCYARRDEYQEGPPLSGPGYIQLVLNLRSVLQNLWNLSPSNVADFSLYDITDAEAIPLYTQLAGQNSPEATPVPFSRFATPDTRSRELVLGGRIWRASYRPHSGWVDSRRSASPLLLLGGGLLFTVLGFAYLQLLLRHTARIRREVAERTAELSESRALLDTVIRHNPSAIWVKDSELRFRLVNAEFCRIYNRAAEDLIGFTDTVLYPPPIVAENEQVDRDVLATGQTRHFEYSYSIGDQIRTYLVGKFPLRRPDGTVNAVAGFATDITERRRAEHERAAIERRLLETQKLESLGVLAGGIAHDFNNLLTGILGHSTLCRAQLPPNAQQQHSLSQIEQAARRAAELCQQMLAYSGRGRFAVESIEFGALVRDTVPLLSISLSRQARLHFELAPGLPPIVADATQLRQIVMNLVMNASDALGGSEGDITLRTRLVTATPKLFSTCVHAPGCPAGDYICLDVVDTGCGMAPETIARIFDPFFTTKFTGRGLGLAAVLGIVRGHGGALRVASQPGKGTTFQLYLPVAPTPGRSPMPSNPLSDPATVSRPFPAAQRLLLVDDEESVRETAAAILRTFGYEIDTANNGDEALALFRADTARHHAAILDLTMPGLSGGELLTALRALRGDLPVLLMSGYSETDAADLLNAPHTLFLAKPFTVTALREKLARLL